MSEPADPWTPPPDPTPEEHVHPPEELDPTPPPGLEQLPSALEPRAGQTPNGLPYPSPNEPVAQGAAAIQSLAEAVDPLLGAEYGYGEYAGDITANPNFANLFDTYLTLPGGVNYKVEYWFSGYITDHTAATARFYCHASGPDANDRAGSIDVPLTNMNVQFPPLYICRRIGGVAGQWRFWIDINITSGTGQMTLKGNTGTGNGYFPMWYRISKW
jgi:hypothetical protein